jgi:hypothetical protein
LLLEFLLVVLELLLEVILVEFLFLMDLSAGGDGITSGGASSGMSASLVKSVLA